MIVTTQSFTKGSLMDVQVKAGSLVRTILHHEISGMVGKIVSQLHSEMTSVVSDFLSAALPGTLHYRGHSTFRLGSGIGATGLGNGIGATAVL